MTRTGITCGEVLADLSALRDGELPRERADRIRAHLGSCAPCERYGGRVQRLLSAARTLLALPPALDPDVSARLSARLRTERSG